VASADVRKGLLEPLLPQWSLPAQEIHAVYPSPNMVPAKVTQFVDWLQGRFDAQWWTRAP
jgi:DNA-binding transcriptional LysR family regulator